ncbi:poly(U)-specific endoribonuclease homolog isoform X2 [Portunus trituberculatus]|uniref:poly(U)-specific endoribonuclease homolog isoform X2 n=1 Tax=Portunus trituberculatus TaxID=210409 RepID=UPI001E1CF579|nr:poly(U)-specific endoribonuclease homolog isoform X2 [Portunus trituberculatus]
MMRGWWCMTLVAVLCTAAGAAGCARRATTTTTTTAPPIIEPEIQTIRTSSQNHAGGSRGQGGSRSRSSTNSVMSTTQLRAASEELLAVDTGMTQPSTNVQGKTSGSVTGDAAPRPLFTSVPRTSLSKDTVRLMQQLLDNYEPQTTRRETITNAERAEENQFLQALMQTSVMQKLETILQQKNLLQGRLRDILKLIWFTPYTRGGQHLASSGFEHVFVGEVKNRKVSGFHNWLSFLKEEGEGDLDYKGYIKKLDLGNKGEIIKMRFVWLSDTKPVGTVFVGTTPELEMALYTLCFLAKPNSRCPVQLNGKKFQIQTWTQSYQGKTLVGSAYPEI